MTIYDERWFWTNLGEDQLGVRFRWSEYLPYFLEDQVLAYEWQKDLQSQVAIAVAENLLPSDHTVSYGVSIEQVGPAAQECHEILLWLSGLPKEIITGLLVIGVERSVSSFIGYVKHRVNDLRRVDRGHEVEVAIDVHPRTIIELCKEHILREYGETATRQTL